MSKWFVSSVSFQCGITAQHQQQRPITNTHTRETQIRSIRVCVRCPFSFPLLSFSPVSFLRWLRRIPTARNAMANHQSTQRGSGTERDKRTGGGNTIQQARTVRIRYIPSSSTIPTLIVATVHHVEAGQSVADTTAPNDTHATPTNIRCTHTRERSRMRNKKRKDTIRDIRWDRYSIVPPSHLHRHSGPSL